MAPFGDVLNALENARQAAWAERSPLNRSTGGGSSGGGVGNAGDGGAAGFSGGVCLNRGHRGSLQHGGLPNSHSQPIYVPGKYSVSKLTQRGGWDVGWFGGALEEGRVGITSFFVLWVLIVCCLRLVLL